MNDLIVIAYADETHAEAARARVIELQSEYLVELADAVVAVKTLSGAIKLNQMFSTTAAGAAGGTFWGALVGLIFLNPLIGAAIGAASGAISGSLTDFGIEDGFMKDAAQVLPPGGAALFLLTRKITTDKVIADLGRTGGTILRTSFDAETEAKLRAAMAGAAVTPAIAATPAPPQIPPDDTTPPDLAPA